MNQNHGNLRNKPAFNALIPTSRTIPTLLRRGPYSGRLYQDVLEKILNNDRHDVILLDAKGQHLYRIIHADWISEDKYNRQMSKVLKNNGLSVDAGGNLIKLSTPITHNTNTPERKDLKAEVQTPEGNELGKNLDTNSTEVQEQAPAGDNSSPENTENKPESVNVENTNQHAGSQNKNHQNGKKNK